MTENKPQEEPEIVYKNPCYQCGMPVSDCNEDLGLCDECAEAEMEDKEMEDINVG